MAERDIDLDRRSEQAFRAAIEDLEVDVDVDPAAARNHVRRLRLVGLTAIAVALLAVGLALPQALSSSPTGVSIVAGRNMTADGWRTEHYRNITFEVPASWTYAYEPTGDCSDTESKSHYVALGIPPNLNSIGCNRSDSKSLRTEHAAVMAAPPFSPMGQPGHWHTHGWWLSIIVVDDVALRAVSRDREVVNRILGSVKTV